MSQQDERGDSGGAGGSPGGAAAAFPGEPIVEMRIVARPERLRLVRAVVSEAATSNGCSHSCAQDIVIAVDEACQNVIRHAYGGDPRGEILLDIRRDGDRLAFHLVDFAPPIDQSKVRPRALEELKPGGLGTHFMKTCMDECGFLTPPAGAGNCLRMVKRIS
ncbi:MAG: ATP-binding protein [Gammaproteobacteria bacterium]|nr:ATP-binding protein [Gammaproteobacteria bacterium]